MAYPQPYVCQATAAALLSELKLRLPSLSLQVVQSEDSSGNPVLTISPSSGASWVTGQQYAVIRVNAVPTINQDVFGNTDATFSNMWLQCDLEGNLTQASALPATSNFGTVLSFQNELTIYGVLLRVGTKVSIYNSANGVQPSTATMVAADLVATFDDLIWPLVGSR